MKKIKLRRRITINKFKTIFFVLIMFSITTGVQKVDGSDGKFIKKEPVKSDYSLYTVSKNDTVWTIADEFEYKYDKREFVGKILEVNKIKGNIMPGDVLVIPEE